MNTPNNKLLKPRWAKVFSDLWGSKTRTLLVVASITVGVFAIGMIVTAYIVLKEDFNFGYAAANPPNIEIWTSPFDKDLVKAVQKIPGVKEAKGASITSVRARRGSEAWQTLDLVGVSNFSSGINRVTTVEGTSAASAGEIVVSQDFLHITGYHVGDPIELKFADGSKHNVTVAGLIKDQTKSKPNLGASNYASITLKTLDRFGQSTTLNRLYVTVDGNGGDLNHIAEVAARVEDQLNNSGRSVYRSEQSRSTVSPIESLALTVMNMLLILGIMTTILSSTLIINMLNSLLMQQMRQIGVMKLVGGRSYQVMGMYLVLIVTYGLIALILAVPLAAVAGYQMANFIAVTSGATLQGFRVIPLAVFVQTLMAFLIPLAAGFVPVQNGAKISVQQAISSARPNEVIASRGLTRLITQWLSQFSRPILVSFRNTFRKKGRLLLTIFTLTVAGAVFMAVFNIRGSLEGVLDQLLQHFMGDVTVGLTQEYRVDEIRQTLMQVPGVIGVEGWSSAAGEVWDEKHQMVTRLSISAPPQDTQLLRLNLTAGRWLAPGEDRAIVVSDTIRQFYPNLQPGDTLTIKLPNRHEDTWTVVGIFPFLSLLGDPIAYANFDFIAEQNFTPNQASAYRIVASGGDAGAQAALIQRIEQHLADQKYPVASLQSGTTLRNTASSAINMLIAFLLIMAILIAVVGSLGLTGTMSMNVLERTREIGVMRTIGASDGAIMRSVITEGLTIGLITWALAVALSFPISSLLATVIGKTLLQSDLPLEITPVGMLLWLGLVVLLSVIASVAPARSAARLTINEVLAYE
jgi:putative ABC transport system permease protein